MNANKNSDIDIILAEAYLNGSLEASEQLEVEERIKKDPEFSRLVKDLPILMEGIRMNFRQQIIKQLKGIDSKFPNPEIDEEVSDPKLENEAVFNLTKQLKREIQIQNIPKRKYLLLKLSGVAAAILILILVMWGKLWVAPQEKLFHENFVQADLPTELASRTFYVETLKQEAYGAYKNEKYQLAIPKLEELHFQYKDTLSLYFLAICQLAANNPDQAIVNFNKFDQLDFKDIRYQDTYYYIALAYIRKKEYQKAIDVLENQSSIKAQKLKNDVLKDIKSL